MERGPGWSSLGLPIRALIHPTTWNKRSPKFAVAISVASYAWRRRPKAREDPPRRAWLQ